MLFRSAAFFSATLLLLLYFGEGVGQIIANMDLARLIFELTLRGHFAPSFAIGVIRAQDIVYYAGVIVIMLHIAIRFIESKRWRA